MIRAPTGIRDGGEEERQNNNGMGISAMTNQLNGFTDDLSAFGQLATDTAQALTAAIIAANGSKVDARLTETLNITENYKLGRIYGSHRQRLIVLMRSGPRVPKATA